MLVPARPFARTNARYCQFYTYLLILRYIYNGFMYPGYPVLLQNRLRGGPDPRGTHRRER